jgi:hypothetical protein
LFLEGLELHGKTWKKIASLIPTRTIVQIRTHAQKHFLKVQKSRPGEAKTKPVDKIGNKKVFVNYSILYLTFITLYI